MNKHSNVLLGGVVVVFVYYSDYYCCINNQRVRSTRKSLSQWELNMMGKERKRTKEKKEEEKQSPIKANKYL